MEPEAAAARTSVNNASGGRAVQGHGDLVKDLEGDKDLLKNAKPEELPENMQKMTAEEREKYVDTQKAKRAELNTEIAKVVKERDEYVKAEQKKLEGKGDAFDVKVSEVVKEEASRAKK
jgi:hypothetical protein